MHFGDMTDSTNLVRLIKEIQPDEIYNLAAMSHVRVSFDVPEYVADADGIGTLRLLEAIGYWGLRTKRGFTKPPPRSCMGLQEVPQTENTPHYWSPYAVAKMYAYWITVNYREAMAFLRPMASCSTTRVQSGERPLSRGRSLERSSSNCPWRFKTNST